MIDFEQKEFHDDKKLDPVERLEDSPLKVLIQNTNDVIQVINLNGIFKYVSPVIEQILGYKPEERLGKNLFEIYNNEESQILKNMVKRVLDSPDKTVRFNFESMSKYGKKVFLEVRISNQLNEPSINGIVISYRDITRRINMEKQLEYIYTHDNLTGLYNRSYFDKTIKALCKSKETPFALMLLDIDNFKYINNALGFHSGDKLIIQITQRLNNLIGTDNFIGRISGDQFAIIVQGFSKMEEYERIAKDIMNVFATSFIIDNHELSVTASLGLSIFPDDGEERDSLENNANTALLYAKKEGKNRYKFHSANTSIISYKQFQIRNDLHKAIKNNQLRVHYQPLVNLKTGEILAAEALIRWEHPTWGLVPTDEFIFIAEDSGFIVEIGKWIFSEVCHTYKGWLENGYPKIKISINCSIIQFYEQDFVENIINTLEKFGLDPGFLIVEITESTLIKHADKAINDIKKLQELGIQIALDDFGTGYSSLEYLNSFNIDIIKIDNSFIKNIPSDSTSTIITSNVINLAKKLGIKLVAEGIETWDQLSYLRKLNCHTGQGYLYSKPLSADKFETVLKSKKCRPVIFNTTDLRPKEERRKYFRINFNQLLEGDMTIVELDGRKLDVGRTKVLIENIGPGGLSFYSNINFPVKRDIVLQFKSLLLDEEIKVWGFPVWINEVDEKLYKYGIEFTIDENNREELIKVLNKVQIKMRNNILFAEGSFVTCSANAYFNSHPN